MKQLPASPDLSHLKKQAKELLRSFQSGDTEAVKRIAEYVPSAHNVDLKTLAKRTLQLHDTQSCLAREYGFPSWAQLKESVESKIATQASREEAIRQWLVFVYGQGYRNPKPHLAARVLRDRPNLLGDDPYLACAAGSESVLRRSLDADLAWADRPGGAMGMPPLVAVTHSGLVRVPEYAERLERCASLLLDRGADVNMKWTNPQYPQWPLSPLYGAAGKNHHPGMTRLLLERGADPNENESLYHSVESNDLTCTRLLLDAGARVEGSNAVAHALDSADLEWLKLLLAHTKSLREHDSHALAHAVRRGRSIEVIQMLLDKGADPTPKGRDATSAYRFAMLYGRPEVARLFDEQGHGTALSEDDMFAQPAREETPMKQGDNLRKARVSFETSRKSSCSNFPI